MRDGQEVQSLSIRKPLHEVGNFVAIVVAFELFSASSREFQPPDAIKNTLEKRERQFLFSARRCVNHFEWRI
jgi:hypothetical protein